jgi:hypothetical protein
MKFKLFAMVIVFALAAWAQDNPTTSTPNASQAPAKSCCHHGADAKDSMACGHHASADAKDAMDCCGKDKCDKKDAKSCCSGKKNMKACMKACKKEGACKDGKCCGADQKSAMNCCGNKCEHHEHAALGS